MGQIFLGVFSVLMGFVSFPCTAAAVYDLISGTDNVTGSLIGDTCLVAVIRRIR